jgi:hypothetical protein
MKKWINWFLVEAVMVVAIVVICWLIKIQLTPVAQAKVVPGFEIYVQTDNGLIPYSKVKIVKVQKLKKDQQKMTFKPIFRHRRDIQKRISELEPELANTLIRLAHCESTLNPAAVGDYGNSLGLFQIFLKWHPDVTPEQALDVEFATRWTAKKIRQGQGDLWTCWDMI